MFARLGASKAETAVLLISLGLQIAIIAIYVGLVVGPFYANDLHLQPRDKVVGGSFEPQRRWPFCDISADAPGPHWLAGRCADGTAANPWGGGLLFGARFSVVFGPVLLGLLGLVVWYLAIEAWPRSQVTVCVIGIVQLGVSLGAIVFAWGMPLGRLLFLWIVD